MKVSFIAQLLVMKQETPRYPALVERFADMTSTTMRYNEAMANNVVGLIYS